MLNDTSYDFISGHKSGRFSWIAGWRMLPQRMVKLIIITINAEIRPLFSEHPNTDQLELNW